ncbi:MAG: DUF983 domain-containing protein [Planctomycetota bacterium]
MDSTENGTSVPTPPLGTALARGIRGRCPQCGEGSLFKRWHLVHPCCSECGCAFEDREGDCWAFMYVSMAGIVGLLIIVILLFVPSNLAFGRVGLMAVAIGTIVLTLPPRKGIAMALDIVFDPEMEYRSKDIKNEQQ